jgi:hypothetical protein
MMALSEEEITAKIRGLRGEIREQMVLKAEVGALLDEAKELLEEAATVIAGFLAVANKEEILEAIERFLEQYGGE